MTSIVLTIALADARKEYMNNSSFRQVIQSGCFIYVEGSYVLDLPEYIKFGKDRIPELTDYARKNLSQCALAFSDTKIYKYSGSSMRGDSNGQTKIEVKHSINYKPESQHKELSQHILKQREAAKRQFQSQRKLIKTCWERIYEILQENHAKPSTFETTTYLHRDYFSRAKTGKESPPDVRTIIAIAAGYNLGLYVTEELMRLAGRTFNPTSKEHDAFIFLITSMHGYDMDTKNQLLVQEGFEPLGTKPREERSPKS